MHNKSSRDSHGNDVRGGSPFLVILEPVCQMQSNEKEPWGDEISSGFPQLGGDVERKLVLYVRVQAQGSLASVFVLHSVWKSSNSSKCFQLGS